MIFSYKKHHRNKYIYILHYIHAQNYALKYTIKYITVTYISKLLNFFFFVLVYMKWRKKILTSMNTMMDHTTWLIYICMKDFLSMKILTINMILMWIKYWYIKKVIMNMLLDIMT